MRLSFVGISQSLTPCFAAGSAIKRVIQGKVDAKLQFTK